MPLAGATQNIVTLYPATSLSLNLQFVCVELESIFFLLVRILPFSVDKTLVSPESNSNCDWCQIDVRLSPKDEYLTEGVLDYSNLARGDFNKHVTQLSVCCLINFFLIAFMNLKHVQALKHIQAFYFLECRPKGLERLLNIY